MFKIDFLLIIIFINFICCDNSYYNIPDPECTGSFGLCTQRDKDTLGYKAIKKLHELIDDDQDGQVEELETKEFMKEELQYKNGFERQTKLHASDSLITVDELWKSWKNSDVHNWTTDDVVFWLVDQVKLPQYTDNFRRNHIDGQFLPRFAINENNYYSNVMQIKDPRHRNRIMLKATDLVLFGQQLKANSLIKDVFMLTALTLSLFGCIIAFSKHRKSQEQIKQMMKEFDQIGSDESNLLQFKNDKTDRKSTDKSCNDGSTENVKLMNELKAAKDEAENLKKARESTISELQRLKLAEQELEKVRMALQQTEKQLNLTKYQAPVQLVQLLTRTYESEKELLEFKFKLIDQEKEICLDELNKVSKRQSGILGALKIAHSSALEEINSKLELLKCQIQRCKIEKQEWSKRWTNIDEIISRNADASNSNISDTTSQDFPFFSLDNGLILPRRILGFDSQSNLNNNNTFSRYNRNLIQNKVNYNEDTPKSVYSLISNTTNSIGLSSIDDADLSKKQLNNSNSSNKLKLITSSARLHSQQTNINSNNINTNLPSQIKFTLTEDENQSIKNVNINNQIENNLLAPKSTQDDDLNDKTPTNSIHNIPINDKKFNTMDNQTNYHQNNIEYDKTSNLSFRNFSLHDENIDKISDVDSLCKNTNYSDNSSEFNKMTNQTITTTNSTTFNEKKRSKTMSNLRKILPFVKITRKVKTK